MKTGLIYKATSPSGKCYVGYTTNMNARKDSHKNKSFDSLSYEYEYAFHCAIRKYGFENIKWKILEDNIPEELLAIKECEWIQGLNSYRKGYNETIGGERPSESFLKKAQEYNKSIMVPIKCIETRSSI